MTTEQTARLQVLLWELIDMAHRVELANEHSRERCDRSDELIARMGRHVR